LNIKNTHFARIFEYGILKLHSQGRDGGLLGWRNRMEEITRRKNGAGQVYSKLKHLLINYRFKPDAQLHPTELADRLKVSSTPVREALHHLAGEHLLLSVPNKGFYSKVLAFEEMKELFVITTVLLQHAISEALSNEEKSLEFPTFLDRANFAKIDQILSDAYFIEEVFNSIAAMSGNQSLSMLIRNLNDRTHYLRLLDLENGERRSQLLQQVQSLVGQVRTRNIADATGNLHEQLRSSLLRMPQLVKEGLARSYSISAFDVALSDRLARSA
jgi:DNA-binding GntR family transcriptional regulator